MLLLDIQIFELKFWSGHVRFIKPEKGLTYSPGLPSQVEKVKKYFFRQ